MLTKKLLSPACLKRLTAVEANPDSSNQHELNGVNELRSILGEKRHKLNAKFFVQGTSISDDAVVTWYDSRENDPKRSAEFRLYFQSNSVMAVAQEGESMMIGFDNNSTLNFILIKTL